MSFLGNAVIVLAFLAALYTILASLLDSRKNKYGFPTNARYGVFAVAGLMTLAEILLLISLLMHNFSLAYVTNFSSSDTPLIYLITGLWAGNAGALLFWAWIIAIAGAILLWRSNKSSKELMPAALAVILFIEMIFLILIFIESPFAGLSPVPADGYGLNPLLQNFGMILHPPALLAGFALFTVPFALAVSAFINRKVDDAWVLSSKSWTLAAWLLLGVGNVLGMWWAYGELGWGGYWGWDPVENAGLMPWLLMTAFLHSIMMYLRRGMFKMWTAILAMSTFSMIVFGAFLTRSEVTGSVHTFGETPMSSVFSIFLVATLVGSAWLLVSRRKIVKSESGDDTFISGTGTFLGISLLLVLSTVFILIGTALPAFSSIVLPVSYFNTVNLPIFLLIILLAGICVLVGWKKPDTRKFGRQLLWPALAGALVVVILIVAGFAQWYALASFFIMAAVFVATAIKWGGDVAARMRGKKEGFLPAFGRLFMANRSRYGGYIIHTAIVIIALGIVGSSVYKSEAGQIVDVGGTIELNGYTLTYNGFEHETEQKSDVVYWMTVTASMDISRGGETIKTVHPSQILKFVYVDGVITNVTMISNDVAIISNLAEDYYVVFEDFDGDTEQALIAVLVNPLVLWIWIGGALLLIGGLVSFSAAPRKPEIVEKG